LFVCVCPPARGAHRIFSRGVIGGGRGQWLEGTMASAEHEPITGVWGRAPSRVQGQSPWSGGQGGRSPLKPKAFCRVTVLGKLFTFIRASVHQAAKLVAALLRVAGVTAGLVESNGCLPPGL